ncbi:condensation domain-containing protein [Streptomyces sp. R28]|uniref:Condensation domain-containing protein n=1 Tax=Streptomyces sp. R28 TaxID=3238628 RepID=A0AB39QDG4_9ACTN
MAPKDTESSCVEFRGATSGSSALTWGQKQMCMWMADSAPYIEHMNLGVLVECTRPTSLEDVRDALKVVIERHEALRTRLNVREDGTFEQMVCAAGKVPIGIHGNATWNDSGTILEELKSLPFTIFEWPLRIAVITSGELVAGIVLCLFHVGMDGWSLQVLHRDIEEFLLATPEERDVLSGSPPRPLLQPREHAQAQLREVGSECEARAEKFWTSQLMKFSNARFPVAFKPSEEPRFSHVTMQSFAVSRALSEASVRYGVSVNTLLISSFSLVLSVMSGLEDATFRLFCANRTASSQHSIGNFSQIVPVAVKVSDLPFREILKGALKTSFAAYRVGERDPHRLDRIVDSVISVRGVDPDLECFVNIHGYGDSHATRRETEAAPDTAIQPTDIRKAGGIEEWEPGKFYLDVWSVSECCEMSLQADTALFSSDQLMEFLRCFEEVLLKIVDAEDLSAQEIVGDAKFISDVRREDFLVRIDESWVDLKAVHEMLSEALSTETVQIFTKGEGPVRSSLTAYLTLDQQSCDPRDVHRILLAEIKRRRFVVTPHWYVICESCPSLPATEEEWRLRGVVAEGSGRS